MIPPQATAPGKSFLRIANLVAHDGGEFQSNEAKADHAKRIQHEARIGGNAEISRGDGGPKPRPHRDAQADQNRCRDEGANCARIVEPLPYSEADDVQDGQQRQQAPPMPPWRTSCCPRGRHVPDPAQTPKRRRSTASPSARTACCWSSSTSRRGIRGSRRKLLWPRDRRRLLRDSAARVRSPRCLAARKTGGAR